MMVANLLLMGSDAGYLNSLFRDHYMSKFFRKSFQSLDPDMLVVLGDVLAKASELTKTKWVSMLQQFHRLIGPFLDLPLHVILGDRDLGRCGELSSKSVSWIAGRFPDLDSAGCGAFEISNVSFLSLNAVALLCGNNDLGFASKNFLPFLSLSGENFHHYYYFDESFFQTYYIYDILKNKKKRIGKKIKEKESNKKK
ncbi:hypothetical protein UlMin_007681 [Ulmus minor]